MPWDDKPIIFTEDGVPASLSPAAQQRWKEQQAEERAEEEVGRICPWCGLLCESVEALGAHEEECE